MVRMEVQCRVEAHATDSTRLTAGFHVSPMNVAAAVFLVLWKSRVERALELSYDMIVKAILADFQDDDGASRDSSQATTASATS